MSPDAAGLAAAAAAGVALAVSLLFVWMRCRRRRTRRGAVPPPGGAEAEGLRPEGVAATPGAAFRVGLTKTGQHLRQQLARALGRDRALAGWLAELEEVLLLADVGMPTGRRRIAGIRSHPRLESPAALVAALAAEIKGVFPAASEREVEERPLVILVAGVNGVGKTTTIGKLAHRYRREGKAVLLVAADTFRAAAAEQLAVWAEREGCDLVRHQSGADPAAVVFDGMRAARSRAADVAIVDTAGRLHVKINLMAELEKIARVAGKEIPGAPHEIYLVLDATTGQNALSQARLFREALPLTGLILTKLDGTAKGGAVIAVACALGLPVRYVGLGEKVEDLRPFAPAAFASALLEADPPPA